MVQLKAVIELANMEYATLAATSTRLLELTYYDKGWKLKTVSNDR